MFGCENFQRIPTCKGQGSELVIVDCQHSKALRTMEEIFELIAVNILDHEKATNVWRRGSYKELKSTDYIWLALTFRKRSEAKKRQFWLDSSIFVMKLKETSSQLIEFSVY